MKRVAVLAGTCLLAWVSCMCAVSPLGVSATMGNAALSVAHAATAELTPCPGPYAYKKIHKGQGTVVGDTGSITKHAGLGTRCEPPPSGPFPSPTLCGVRFTGYAAPYSVITCTRLAPSLCGTSDTNGVVVVGTGLNLDVPGYHIYKLVGTGFVEVTGIRGPGGQYEILQRGSPTNNVQTAGVCTPIIPLPQTGGAAASPGAVASPQPNRWTELELALLATGFALSGMTFMIGWRRRAVQRVRR